MPGKKHAEQIKNQRIYEIKHIIKSALIRSCMFAYSLVAMPIYSFGTFVLYNRLGNQLTASKVYGTISIFVLLKWQVANMFGYSILTLADALVASKRLTKFFKLEEKDDQQVVLEQTDDQEVVLEQTDDQEVVLEEKDDQEVVLKEKNSKEKNICIKLDNVSCKWYQQNSANNLVLKNITLDIKDNEFVAIIGPTGSSKSSLLMTILKELPIVKGSLTVQGKIAYASQLAWNFSGTIQDNITLKQNDDINYQLLNDACLYSALIDDLKQFDNGLKTEVGESGITLSGGQSSRLSLARCLYTDADIYLLDDPLSAVDSVVGKYLFNQCFCHYLKDKLRILVTHQVQYLQKCDRIIVLNQNGTINNIGTYDQLIQLDYVQDLLSKYANEEQQQQENDDDDDDDDSKKKKKNMIIENKAKASDIKMINKKQENLLLQKEYMEIGKVKTHVYKEYFQYLGGNRLI